MAARPPLSADRTDSAILGLAGKGGRGNWEASCSAGWHLSEEEAGRQLGFMDVIMLEYPCTSTCALALRLLRGEWMCKPANSVRLCRWGTTFATIRGKDANLSWATIAGRPIFASEGAQKENADGRRCNRLKRWMKLSKLLEESRSH